MTQVILADDGWMDTTEYIDIVEPVLEGGGEAVFICRGGVRSRLAAEVAEGRDGVRAVNFVGGQEAWERFLEEKGEGVV